MDKQENSDSSFYSLFALEASYVTDLAITSFLVVSLEPEISFHITPATLSAYSGFRQNWDKVYVFTWYNAGYFTYLKMLYTGKD